MTARSGFQRSIPSHRDQEHVSLRSTVDVEHAARHYLAWSGRPLDQETLAHAANHIRGLDPGRPLPREDLHVQLVVDELFRAVRRR